VGVAIATGVAFRLPDVGDALRGSVILER
jgi:hypothetical protein